MDTEPRLAALEKKLRHTRLLLLGLFVCLFLVGTIAANNPHVDLVCRSLLVKDSVGKTTIELRENGDVAVKGKLLVGDTDLLDALSQQKHIESGRFTVGYLEGAEVRKDADKSFEQKIEFKKPYLTPPEVIVMVEQLSIGGRYHTGLPKDLQFGDNPKARPLIASHCAVTQITTTGFILNSTPWDGCDRYSISVRWVAVPK